MKKYIPLFAIAFLFTLGGCKQSSETYSTINLSDYSPLTVGKYITYRLDSLVYLSFGTRDTSISYEVKFVNDADITDNLGRRASRIIRYIRKTAANPWVPDATFMAVNDTTSFEFIENNLRYIKLRLPVKDGTNWKGNSYIDTYSLNSELKYLDDWDYTYEFVGQAETIGTFSLENTLTVNQRDEIIGDPLDPASYSEVNISVEKYALGIGLVYRKFFHSEYQPGSPAGYFADGSYGVTLTMIDHN